MDDIQFSPVQRAAANLLADMMTIQRTYTGDLEAMQFNAIHKAIEKALDAYAADLIRVARQTALEQACQAVCSRCERGIAIRPNEIGEWVHGPQNAPCYAAAIRGLMAAPTLQNTPPNA